MKNKFALLLFLIPSCFSLLKAQVIAHDDSYNRGVYPGGGFGSITYTVSVLANDSDSFGFGLLVNLPLLSNPIHGTCTMNSNGTFTYYPSSSVMVTDSFAYIVCSSSLPAECDTAIVHIYSIDCNTSNIDVNFLSIQPADCSNNLGGSILFNGTGGVPPYTFAINAVGNNNTGYFTGIPPSNNWAMVEDAIGCNAIQAFYIQQTGNLTITQDTLINLNCSGSLSGSISIHVTGGSAPYFYLWAPGNITTPSINNLTPGTYTITVDDASGCSGSQSYTISHSNNLYVSITSTNANCQNNGTAAATVFGTHPPYTYLWSDSIHQTTATATNLAGGYYTVIVTDSTGCQSPGSVYILSNCHNIIKGKIYNDLNGNCIQDSGELGISGKVVYSSPGNEYGYTDANGNYTILTDSMNNLVTISSYNNSCPSVLTCPANGSLNVNFSQLGDTSLNNNFAYGSISGNFDFTLHPGWNSASPGFSKLYWIYYYNHGPTTQNAVLTFVYDSVLIYNSCTQGGVHFPAQHKIEWTFNNVAPSTGWNWLTRPQVFFTIPATFGIHDSLCSYFEITPVSGDCYPADNTLSRCEPVTGSLDPNEKSVFPTGQGVNGNILASDSLLFYTIHFQNTGNDTAFTVVVTDTLSLFLDPATIIPGAASHPYTFDLSGQGVLTFRFDNILLPDSNINEPASNGYFNYTIRQKANNPVGSVIENRGYIYFDFNAAVITNTVVNTIYSTVGLIENISSNDAVKIFPNPFSDKTTFVIQSQKANEIYSFELQDVTGKKLKSINKITEKQFFISRNGLVNGIYFYKIYSSSGLIAIGKLVIE